MMVNGASQNGEADYPVVPTLSWQGRKSKRTGRASWPTAIVAALAALVLVGWSFDIESLKRIVPGFVAVNPMTAIAFALGALSLWLFGRDNRNARSLWRTIVGPGCAVLVVGIGALKLLALASSFDAGVDRWFFASRLAANSVLPNSMAPNSAVNFVLLGSALLLLHARNRKISAWACIFALISGFEALLAILGYVYGIESFYGVGSFIPMALHTAISFLVMSFGIMAAQSDRGFLAILMGKNAGGAMARTLLPAAIVVPVLLGWLRLEGQRIGLYDGDFGVVLYTVTNMLVFGSIVACNALSVFRADMKRTKAELSVQRARAGLERRVAERTEELAYANADLERAAEELEERVRERTANLGETEARLHAIVDNANSVILVKDLEGRILLTNQRFAALVGRPKEEIIGHTDGDFFPAEMARQFRANDTAALWAERAIEVEETAATDDGLHTFIANKFPLRDAGGKIYALCDISTDITERKRAGDALEKAREEADRANRAKSEFLSRMSHELRTPMNAILGFAQLLELDELNENQRDGVGHILRGGHHLLQLTNEVLDIARIEAGHLSLSCEPVELSAALQETLDLVRTLAAERGIRLISVPAPSCHVMADRQRLKQVLINLVSNAISTIAWKVWSRSLANSQRAMPASLSQIRALAFRRSESSNYLRRSNGSGRSKVQSREPGSA